MKLEFYLHESFAQMRFREMFDVIRDYPDTAPCLADLKAALERTHMQQALAEELKGKFCARLLLPGVGTITIIELYIQTIRVMKLIDPSALLLEVVSEPIRAHLRRRKDTLRCIVNAIISDDAELYGQLGDAYTRVPLRKQLQATAEEEDGNISSDEDEAAAEAWEPARVDPALAAFISAKSRKSDIISTLVNVYGSQDAFLAEYVNMLVERLLSGDAYEYD